MTIYLFPVWLALVLIFGNVLANLFVIGRLRKVEAPSEGPLVSVLLPARNEERNIETCLRSLLMQDYPAYEVLVLDDHSSDRTAEIAERVIAEFRNPRVSARVIRGEDLPEGWVGKNWACHQLSEAASGDFLFFTDADTIHESGTISAAADFANRKNASLVSAWPRQITETPAEKIVIPMIYFLALGFCPIWLQRLLQHRRDGTDPRTQRLFGLANGQFLFFTRTCYKAIGGHAAVSSHLVEDVAFGREIAARAAEGYRLFNCDALNFSSVRMYHSYDEIWEGFSKNLRAVFEGHAILFWCSIAVQVGALIAPFFLLATHFHAIIFSVCEILFIRALIAIRFRSDWRTVLLHPVGAIILVLIQFDSWRRSRGKGVTWKGRVYKPNLSKQNLRFTAE